MSMHHFVAHFLKVVYGYAPWRRWVEYDFVSIIVRPVIATDSINAINLYLCWSDMFE